MILVPLYAQFFLISEDAATLTWRIVSVGCWCYQPDLWELTTIPRTRFFFTSQNYSSAHNCIPHRLPCRRWYLCSLCKYL